MLTDDEQEVMVNDLDFREFCAKVIQKFKDVHYAPDVAQALNDALWEELEKTIKGKVRKIAVEIVAKHAEQMVNDHAEKLSEWLRKDVQTFRGAFRAQFAGKAATTAEAFKSACIAAYRLRQDGLDATQIASAMNCSKKHAEMALEAADNHIKSLQEDLSSYFGKR